MEEFKNNCVKRLNESIVSKTLYGILAGMFIAFAGFGSAVLSSNIADPGLAKLLSGVIFSSGLIMIVISGSHLFTGSVLNIMNIYDKKEKLSLFWKTLIIIYLANLIGSFLIVTLIFFASLNGSFNQTLIETLINIANKKCNLTFNSALASGILCNILVCTAVYLAALTKEVSSKIMAILFPITLFIICGFEHIVANMFFLPIAFLLKLTGEKVVNLNVSNLFLNNVITVTIGNIVGGFIIASFLYFAHKHSKST